MYTGEPCCKQGRGTQTLFITHYLVQPIHTLSLGDEYCVVSYLGLEKPLGRVVKRHQDSSNNSSCLCLNLSWIFKVSKSSIHSFLALIGSLPASEGNIWKCIHETLGGPLSPSWCYFFSMTMRCNGPEIQNKDPTFSKIFCRAE